MELCIHGENTHSTELCVEYLCIYILKDCGLGHEASCNAMISMFSNETLIKL